MNYEHDDEVEDLTCPTCKSDKHTYFNLIVEETLCTSCDEAMTIEQWVKKKPILAPKFGL
jgi:hypothetical protein